MKEIKLSYAIRKNGKYLSSIFGSYGDGLEFEALKVGDSYRYDTKQIALDIGQKHGCDVVAVFQPNAPFGEYVCYVDYIIENAIDLLEYAIGAVQENEQKQIVNSVEDLKTLLKHIS